MATVTAAPSSVRFSASGWPWQPCGNHWANHADGSTTERWGWNPFRLKGMGRFGGGWAFKLGITTSRDMRDWIFDLGLGSIRVTLPKAVKP